MSHAGLTILALFLALSALYSTLLRTATEGITAGILRNMYDYIYREG
jgi:hypothetical protein